MTSTTTATSQTASMDLPFAKFHNALHRLRSRVRTGLLIEGLAIIGIALAIYFVVTLPLDRFFRLETPVRAVLLLILIGVVAWLLFKRCVQPMLFELDDEELALAVERTNEPLSQRLISALQFERRFQEGVFHGDSPELMRKVVADLPAALDEVRFHEAVRRERVVKNLLFALLSFGLLAACAAKYDGFGLWAKRNLLLSSIDWPRATMLSVLGAVDGEILVPRGDDFTIEVEAAGVVPESVSVRYRFDGGTTGTDTMTQNVGESRFSYTFPGVLDPMTLEAWGGDGVTGDIRVRLVDRPQLLEENLRLEYPAYMGKEAQAIDAETTQVIVPRGTRVLITARSSKPLEKAELQVGDGQREALTVSADGLQIQGAIAPEESGLLVARLMDRDGLSEDRAAAYHAQAPLRDGERTGADRVLCTELPAKRCRHHGRDGATAIQGTPLHAKEAGGPGKRRLAYPRLENARRYRGHADHATRQGCYRSAVERIGRFPVSLPVAEIRGAEALHDKRQQGLDRNLTQSVYSALLLVRVASHVCDKAQRGWGGRPFRGTGFATGRFGSVQKVQPGETPNASRGAGKTRSARQRKSREFWNSDRALRDFWNSFGTVTRSLSQVAFYKSLKTIEIMVGARGFEPPTSCSQSRRATRLRHAPFLPTLLIVAGASGVWRYVLNTATAALASTRLGAKFLATCERPLGPILDG